MSHCCYTCACTAEKSSRNEWAWLIAGAVLLVLATCLPLGFWGKMALFIAAYLCCGVEVLLTSFHNLRRGEWFDENFLMTLATLGAFAIGEYPEGVSVMLFYQIGEKLQEYAAGKSRHKITALMDLRPAFARVLRADNTEVQADPTTVHIGQTVRVRAGERIPLDGTVTHGQSQLDMSSLTGESRPVTATPGTSVLAGSINLAGVLDICVQKTYQNSAVAQILELAEHAATKKSTTEKFITRFARIYTPVVVFLALGLALIPPLLGGSWHDWIYKALIFLVISCPCALVLSVPLGFFGGIGGAAHQGILIKGGTYLELLSRIGTLCFDKTGTLTQGVFEVINVVPQSGITKEALLRLAALAEAHSNHPIAKAILKFVPSPLAGEGGRRPGEGSSAIQHVQEIAGEGISAQYDDKPLLVGNARLLARFHALAAPAVSGTVVHVVYDGQYQGYVELGDRLKPTARQAVTQLQALGPQLALVSGDNPAAVAKTAQEVGISSYRGGLLPAGKMQVLEDFMAHAKPRHSTVFVGDGINDAPVLKRADVGMAMGGLGADAALEAADVVLMGDDPLQVVQALALSRFTMRIIKQNIAFALGVKALVLGLGVMGLANMWLAVFADVGVSLLAVLNSLRPLYVNVSHNRQGFHQ